MKYRKKINVENTIKRPYETLINQFPTENACLDIIFEIRALKEMNGCYRCQRPILEHYKKLNGRVGYQCNKCLYQVYPKSNTVFDHSHIPLKDWFYVAINKIYHNSGFSANKIQDQLSHGAGASWELCQNVRQWIALTESNSSKLKGYIECDESGLNTGTKGMGKSRRRKKRGFGSFSITPIFALGERGGRIKSFVIPDRDETTLLSIIADNVEPGSKIFTDEWRSYNTTKLEALGYEHAVVNHSKGQYKNGEACTNKIEGYWGHLKPGILGTYRQISEKYADLYLAEYNFRYNNRHLPLHERFQKLLDCLPPLFEHIRNKNNQNEQQAA